MNRPLIGYRTLVTPAGISAESTAAGYLASNMAYSNTNEFWRSNTVSEQTITFAVDGTYDYIGLARHNLCLTETALTVEVSDDGMAWDVVYGPEIPSCNGALLIPLESPEVAPFVRFTLDPSGIGLPEIAVVYIGELLELPRRIYVGHTPITYGRSTRVTTGRSENGNFLGRIITSESNETAISMQNIVPAFYRSSIDPWLKSTKDTPFFFAWRPESYPEEVGYVWATNDPDVSNQRPNGMMQFSLRVTGLAAAFEFTEPTT
jgi:hypothetical protein